MNLKFNVKLDITQYKEMVILYCFEHFNFGIDRLKRMNNKLSNIRGFINVSY